MALELREYELTLEDFREAYNDYWRRHDQKFFGVIPPWGAHCISVLSGLLLLILADGRPAGMIGASLSALLAVLPGACFFGWGIGGLFQLWSVRTKAVRMLYELHVESGRGKHRVFVDRGGIYTKTDIGE